MQKCESKLSLEYKQLSLLSNLKDLVLNTNQPEREIYTETVKWEVFDSNIYLYTKKLHILKKKLLPKVVIFLLHTFPQTVMYRYRTRVCTVQQRFQIRINFMRIQIRIRVIFRGLKTFKIQKKSVFCKSGSFVWWKAPKKLANQANKLFLHRFGSISKSGLRVLLDLKLRYISS